ncbi:MAG TPA: von Willebrand factor type A domain-containing protein [Candidatus Acidoferrum sp.]|nr:von Willebrand factor type A domain-containing protein [Candidatus Acidoferrum sp.]
MTPDSPIDPRQALEASLTALLLGELPPDQAAFLRHVMAGDPELAKIHQRLKQTIKLVRETETTPGTQPSAEQTALKLSDERRQELLQRFKTVAPREYAKPPERRVSWLVPVAVAALFMVLLASMMLPALSRSKSKAARFSASSQDAAVFFESGRDSFLTHHAELPDECARALVPQSSANNLKNISTGIEQPPVASAAPPPTVPAPEPNQAIIVLPPTYAAADQSAVVPSVTADPATTVTFNAGQAYGGYALSSPKSDGDKPLMLGLEFDKVAPGTLSAAQAPVTVPPASGVPGDQSFTYRRVELPKAPPGRDLIASAGGAGGGGIGGGGGVALPLSTPSAVTPTASPPTSPAGRILVESEGVLPAEPRLANTLGDDSLQSAVDRNVTRRRSVEEKQSDQTRAGLNEMAGETTAVPTTIDPTTGLPVVVNRNSGGIANVAGAQTLARRYGLGPGGIVAPPPTDPATGLTTATFQAVDPTTGLPVAIVERTLRAQSQNSDALTPSSNFYSANVVGYANAPSQVTNFVVTATTRGFYEDDARMQKDRERAAKGKPSAIVLPGVESLKQPADSLDGFSAGPPAQVVAINGAITRSGDQASTRQQSATIEAKKRELNELLRSRALLDTKLLTEGTDLMLPKSSMVEIVDKASPPPSQSPGLLAGLGRMFRGEAEARVRIKIERDQAETHSVHTGQTGVAYDPYFIQSEFEVIQSDAVLGKVIKDLNLNKAWAKNDRVAGELKTAETLQLLKKKLDLRPVRNTSLVEIGVKDDKPEEAAHIANAIAEAYQAQRIEQRMQLGPSGTKALMEDSAKQEQKIRQATEELARLESQPASQQVDAAPPKPAPSIPVPQPEVQSRENAFSTFSLNVSDVSFKLAAASLEKGVLPDPASIRSEEFINAFDYRDPEAPAGVPIAFAWERARYPFAQSRDLLRFSLKTAAQGRQVGRPLNLVLLLDNSGSMERADRVQIIREALRVLATQLQPQDTFSVVTFARTARLWVDGVPGSQAGQVAEEVGKLTPQGGTNLGDAMDLAYQTALRHYLANGINRVVLLTDGAANLGDVEPGSLKAKVEANRKQGIALDCFGIGWEGYNDDLLEVLTRNGDGRYGFINTPEEAATEFASQLAGALHVAAADVKVQVELNPGRVTAYRQIGYAKHQLTKEQFRDNTVDAAEIGAAESGNALYVIEANPAGEGPLGTVRVRYRVPGTTDYQEREWVVPYTGNAVALEQSSPAMRLATTASAFSEWLATSPYAVEVTPDALLGYLTGVPDVYGADIRPKKLEWMLHQAKSIGGK